LMHTFAPRTGFVVSLSKTRPRAPGLSATSFGKHAALAT